MHEAKPFPAPRLTLTIREALRATGLGRSTLYKLIDDGKVRRIKVGRRTLVWYDDLQKLVAPEDCAMPLPDQSHDSSLDAGEPKQLTA
jgi:excisionase family DNA binding protein